MNTLTLVVRDGIAALLAIAGLGGMALGVLALLRFPDLYARTHAFTLIGGWPLALTLLALAVAARDGQVGAALAALALIAPAAAPTIAHACASAAQAGGLAPLTGRFVSGAADDDEARR